MYLLQVTNLLKTDEEILKRQMTSQRDKLLLVVSTLAATFTMEITVHSPRNHRNTEYCKYGVFMGGGL